MKTCPTCNQLYRREHLMCPTDGTPLDFLNEWQPGDLVSGRFRIIEKIGQGSLGPVFKAEVLRSKETRALKALGAQLCDDQFIVEQFRRTFQAASRLQHPNVVQMESLELSDDGRLFIVMEYAPGASLRELFQESGRLPVARVVDVAAQICFALECAGRLRLVHRDIRPENVVLTEADGGPAAAKVAEFGIASLREAAAERGRKIGGVTIVDGSSVVGTLEYMSPEQARGIPEYMLDGRSDLYSLGVLMFEALTGIVPLIAVAPERLLLRELEMSGGEPLYSVVMRALHRDPDERYQSASVMASALGEIAASLSNEAALTRMQPEIRARTQSALLPSQASRRSLAAPRGMETPARAPGLTGELLGDKTGDHGVSEASSDAAGGGFARTDEVFNELRCSLAQLDLPSSGQREKRSLARFAPLAALLVFVAFAVGFWLVSRRSEAPSRPPVEPSDHPSVESPQEAPRPSAVSAAEVDETASSPLQPEPTDAQQGSAVAGPGRPTLEPRPTARNPSREVSPVLKGESSAKALVVGSERRAPAEPELRASRPRLPAAQQAELNDKLIIGRFLMERKDYRAAMTVFEEALRIDPSNLEAKTALRMARSAAENPDLNVNPSVRTTPAESHMKR